MRARKRLRRHEVCATILETGRKDDEHRALEVPTGIEAPSRLANMALLGISRLVSPVSSITSWRLCREGRQPERPAPAHCVQIQPFAQPEENDPRAATRTPQTRTPQLRRLA